MKNIFLLVLLVCAQAFPVTTFLGSSPSWKRSVATSTDLPASGNIAGDCITAADNATIWCWDGGAWIASGGGGGSGVDTVGAFSSSAQADGASISGTEITFGPADASTPGMMSTGAQTFAGVKTFNSLPVSSGVPSNGSQLVNKDYADSIASGFHYKEAAEAGTVSALATNTYNNGASGVGATLTANANGALGSIDGYAITTGERLLVKNEVAASHNGIYVVTQLGDGSNPYILTRSTDCDTTAECDQGTALLVLNGTVNMATQWAISNVIATMGTTAINWAQISTPTVYSAGSGLNLTGTTFSIPNLGVTNAMLAGSIADSKLSTISTAGKVLGASLNTLSGIPSGAGVIPAINLGVGVTDSSHFLDGSGNWVTPGLQTGANTITYVKGLASDSSQVAITSTTNTPVFTYPVPAGTLGTSRMIRVVMSGDYVNNSGGNLVPRIVMTYGATNMGSATVTIQTSATTGYWVSTSYLMNQGGSTSVQRGSTTFQAVTSGLVSQIQQAIGNATEDSTAIKNLVMSMAWNATGATITKKMVTVELVNATDTVGAPSDASYVTLGSSSQLDNERVLVGTSNQVVVTIGSPGSTVTLSTPQDIAAASSPTFNGLTLTSLDVGSSKFAVDSNGNITKINNVTTSWPASQGSSNTYLKNDGSGNLSWASAGGGSGVDTVGAFSGSSQTNGASIASTTITFGPADGTNPGMVSTGSQTWAGAKTFSSAPIFSSTTASTIPALNSSKELISSATTIDTANNVWSFPTSTATTNLLKFGNFVIGNNSSGGADYLDLTMGGANGRLKSIRSDGSVIWQLNPSGATMDLFSANQSSYLEFTYPNGGASKIIGSNSLTLRTNDASAGIDAMAIDTAGAVTIGASGSTQTHPVNGNMTVSKILTPVKLVNTVSTLTDGATVNIDASLGNIFTLSAAGDRTIAAPTNATDGQKITIEITASGGARTITLTTGSSGAFAYGSDITGITQTASGKTDLIGCIYNSTLARWLVVAYVKGY